MLKVIITGALGHVGTKITELCQKSDEIEIVCGIDKQSGNAPFNIYDNLSCVTEKADALIDFSNPSLLNSILSFAKKNKMPVVLATTGYTKEQIESIKEASKEIPVFYTANMSLGVNLLSALVKKASLILGDDFDVEIIEKHHNLKIDAPSGTALMLGDAINSVNGDKYVFEYDRHSKREKRNAKEIGIHSVRGGNIVGEHEVIFAGNDEVISLKHSAYSKEVFALGAIKAVKFICTKEKGLYDMSDMLSL